MKKCDLWIFEEEDYIEIYDVESGNEITEAIYSYKELIKNIEYLKKQKYNVSLINKKLKNKKIQKELGLKFNEKI